MMKKLIINSVLGLFLTMSFAQKAPTYSNYAIKEEKKTTKTVNLNSHPKAKKFRTNLKQAIENKQINFSGKYILTQWGCGTACVQAAIIDAQTGTVYMPEILNGVTQGYNPAFVDHEMIEFKKNSKLLVIFGTAATENEDNQAYIEGVWYYEWTGKDFKLLKFVKK